MNRDVPAGRSLGGGTRAYVVGLAVSVALTLTAYLAATRHVLTPGPLVVAVIGLALLQFIVQAIAFLHLGSEERPRWKLYALISMVGMVVVFVTGALWIMNNLNTRMTMDQQMRYMNSQGRP
ncbi:MAG: cytochrome o ubiquinol oxidase subunit IV [Candidatus Dormibacteria bacterium]